MAFVGRAVIVACALMSSAAWVGLGCGSSGERPPPPSSSGSTGGGASSSSSASGAGGGMAEAGAGPENVCACAAEAFTSSTPACADCLKEESLPGHECEAEATACQGDGACVALLGVLKACGGVPACIAAALSSEPGGGRYVDFLSCACARCGAECIYPKPVACDANGTDAGTDAQMEADADAEAGADAGAGAETDAG